MKLNASLFEPFKIFPLIAQPQHIGLKASGCATIIEQFDHYNQVPGLLKKSISEGRVIRKVFTKKKQCAKFVAKAVRAPNTSLQTKYFSSKFQCQINVIYVSKLNVLVTQTKTKFLRVGIFVMEKNHFLSPTGGR